MRKAIVILRRIYAAHDRQPFDAICFTHSPKNDFVSARRERHFHGNLPEPTAVNIDGCPLRVRKTDSARNRRRVHKEAGAGRLRPAEGDDRGSGAADELFWREFPCACRGWRLRFRRRRAGRVRRQGQKVEMKFVGFEEPVFSVIVMVKIVPRLRGPGQDNFQGYVT